MKWEACQCLGHIILYIQYAFHKYTFPFSEYLWKPQNEGRQEGKGIINIKFKIMLTFESGGKGWVTVRIRSSQSSHLLLTYAGSGPSSGQWDMGARRSPKDLLGKLFLSSERGRQQKSFLFFHVLHVDMTLGTATVVTIDDKHENKTQ